MNTMIKPRVLELNFKRSMIIVAITLLTLGVIVVLGNGCSKKSDTRAAPPNIEVPPNAPQEAIQPTCNATTGYFKALETCTLGSPCVHLSEEFTKQGLTQLTVPSVKPDCRKSAGIQDDGEPYSTTGIDGSTRYACIHKPSGAGNRPLIIWFHPGGNGLATNLYTETLLRQKADTYNLGTSPVGYVIASVQGRTLRYPTDWPRDGYHHDFYFRSLGSPSQNPDIAFTDHLIDTLVAQGGIDSRRIYVMGWSNGAMFSQLYAIARHSVATPGGNKIAAAAVFSGGDPFHNINSNESPSCRLSPYPKSDVPIFIVRRSCDAALACDSTQQSWFNTPPGHETQSWLNQNSSLVGANLSSMTIDGFANIVSGCANTRSQCANAYGMATYCSVYGLTADECADQGALVNHLRWPSGIREGGTPADRESYLLDFLKNNPLPL